MTRRGTLLAGIGVTGILACFMPAMLCRSAVPATLKRSAAIVLLAGGPRERIPLAASLFRAGYAPLVILTNDGVTKGWSREFQSNPASIQLTERELVQRGVPREAIVRLPFRHSGTIHDAIAVRAFVATRPVHSVILVTSDYHALRAGWIFRRVLRQPAVSVAVAAAHSSASVSRLLLERVKLLYYLLRYGPLAP